MTDKDLVTCKLWWEGPSWISQPPSSWPPPQFKFPDQIPEVKTIILTAPIITINKPWEKFSDFQHSLRIISWCRRFMRNCIKKPEDKITETHLHTEEVQDTKEYLFLLEQREHFSEVF